MVEEDRPGPPPKVRRVGVSGLNEFKTPNSPPPPNEVAEEAPLDLQLLLLLLLLLPPLLLPAVLVTQ